jgi:hypothetical protein
MTPSAVTWSPSGNSPKNGTAKPTAKAGVRLPSAPARFGPKRRLASKVRKVTTAG